MGRRALSRVCEKKWRREENERMAVMMMIIMTMMMIIMIMMMMMMTIMMMTMTMTKMVKIITMTTMTMTLVATTIMLMTMTMMKESSEKRQWRWWLVGRIVEADRRRQKEEERVRSSGERDGTMILRSIRQSKMSRLALLLRLVTYNINGYDDNNNNNVVVAVA